MFIYLHVKGVDFVFCFGIVLTAWYSFFSNTIINNSENVTCVEHFYVPEVCVPFVLVAKETAMQT